MKSKVPQEINILGENVRMFESKEFQGRAGSVSFQREYFPEADEERLFLARGVFHMVFGSKSIFSLETPLYPCESTEHEILKEGLVRRFYGLRSHLLALMEYEDIKILEKRETYEHLMRLKNLIETMERIYEESNGACMENYDPATGKFTLPMGKAEAEGLRNLLRQFVFLVLQATKPVESWRDREAINPVEFLERLKEQSITKDEMELYLSEYHQKNKETVPVFLSNLLHEVSSTQDAQTAKHVDTYLEQLFEQLIAVVSGTKNDDLIKEAGIISSKSDSYRHKVIALVELLRKSYEECQKTLKSQSLKGNDSDTQLSKSQARVTQLEQQLGELETQKKALEIQVQEAVAKMGECSRENSADPTAFRGAQEKASALAAQLTGVVNTVQGLRADKEKQEGETQRLTGEREAAREQREKAEETIKVMRQELSKANARLAAQAANIRAQQQQIEALKTERDASAKKSADLLRGLQETSSGLQNLKQEKAQLVAQHTQAQTGVQEQIAAAIAKFQADARGSLATGREELAAAERRASAADENYKRLEAEKNGLTSRLAAFEAKGQSQVQAQADLERKLAELQGTSSATTDTLKDAVRDRDQAKGEVAKLTQQLRDEISRGSGQAESLRQELLEARSKYATADAQAREAAAIKQRDDIEMMRMKEQLITINAQIEALKAGKGELEAKLAAAAAQTEEMKSTKEQLVREFEGQKTEFKRQLEELGNRLAAEKASHASQLETMKADHLRQLQEKETGLTEKFNAEKGGLEAQIREQEEKYDEMKRSYDDQIAELRRAIDELNATIEAKEKQFREDTELLKQEFDRKMREKQDELERVIEERKEVQAQLDEARELNAAKDLEIQRLNGEIEKLEGIIKQREDTIINLEDERDAMADEITELKQELTDTQDELESCRATLQEARNRIVQLEGTIRTKDTTIADLRRRLEELNDQKNATEAALVELQEASKFQIAALRKTIAENEEAIKALEAQLNASEGNVRALEETKAALEAEQARLRGQLADVTQKFTVADAASKRLQAERDQVKDDHVEKLAEKDVESQAQVQGILSNVAQLAQYIHDDDDVKINELLGTNAQFQEIYQRMRSIQQVLRPSSLLVCYMRFFVFYFKRTLFFTGTMLDSRTELYTELGKLAMQFLKKQTAAAATQNDWKLYLEDVLPEMFEILKQAEKSSRIPVVDSEKRSFQKNFRSFVINLEGFPAKKESLKFFFSESFPFFIKYANQLVIKNITYPILFAFYILFAEIYLNLAPVQAKLDEYRCPLPKQMRVSLPKTMQQGYAGTAAATEEEEPLPLPSGPEPEFEPIKQPVPLRESGQIVDETFEGPAGNVFDTEAAGPRRAEAPSAPTPDDYAVLKVNPNAPLKTITLAFRREAFKVHPGRTDRVYDPKNEATLRRILGAYLRILAYTRRTPMPTEEIIDAMMDRIRPKGVAAPLPQQPQIPMRRRVLGRGQNRGTRKLQNVNSAQAQAQPANANATTRRKGTRLQRQRNLLAQGKNPTLVQQEEARAKTRGKKKATR